MTHGVDNGATRNLDVTVASRARSLGDSRYALTILLEAYK